MPLNHIDKKLFFEKKIISEYKKLIIKTNDPLNFLNIF